MTPAQRWGAALRAAQEARGVPTRALAEATGLGASLISQLRRGRQVPMMDTAHRIAEALVDPGLEMLAARLRTKRCAVCGRDYVESHRGGYAQLWCSWPCEWTGRYRRRAGIAGSDRVARAALWQGLAGRRQALIDLMCRRCEPTGTCKDAGCPLRPASPFALVRGGPVPIAERGATRRVRRPARAA